MFFPQLSDIWILVEDRKTQWKLFCFSWRGVGTLFKMERVWLSVHYSDYIWKSYTHTHTLTFAGWWTSAQADKNHEMTCTILLLCLEMHIFDNTHLEGLYTPTGDAVAMKHVWVQLLGQWVHNVRTVNHRTIKKRRKEGWKELKLLVRHCTKSERVLGTAWE